MINTTTIPTILVANDDNFFSVFLTGIFAMVPFWACVIKDIFRRNNMNEEDEDDDDYEDDDETKSLYEALLDRELSEEEIINLQKKYVIEEDYEENDEESDYADVDANADANANADADANANAINKIIMTYNKENEAFWYYTNNLKDISYDRLETLARKFVIEYDCKRIYKEAKTHTTADAEAEAGASATKSVFAKFKKYNSGSKGASSKFGSDLKVIEQTNHFRYKGKLCEYEAMLQKDKKPIEIDYATYKKNKNLQLI
jgi:hypothetical protein